MLFQMEVLTARMGAMGSHHPSGALFAFADGRVEFLEAQIDLDLYRAKSTISRDE
jgi:hypothetical protein